MTGFWLVLPGFLGSGRGRVRLQLWLDRRGLCCFIPGFHRERFAPCVSSRLNSRVARELPTGTVTFVFTDVEGSTRLLQQLGADAYADALAEHRRALREAFVRHDGVEVDTQGDSFFIAFSTAPAAIAAAAEAQQVLAAGPIRVRMGIHTGTPHVTDEGYVGPDVHRAARIAAAGHGGQILVSSSTASLVEGDSLRDLGEHRLKDLAAPERIYQLGGEAFPPLRSLQQTNLPIPATPFLGRQRELDEVTALLGSGDARLLTLTGPAGAGKTRLALQAAAEASDHYPDGVFWAPLAALRDPKLVLEVAAQALEARDGLADRIADRRLLLILDNFEHLIDAAGELAGLLAACPNLQLLVTSRELLRLPGEQAYPVPPLEPQDATELFTARARAADPRFEPGPIVEQLCARLDNLPLALELAATRVTVLSPEQLLDRLSKRLDLLKAGRGVDPRQQTLRATIEWSYDLLDEEERLLFERLSVFRGGCTLEAAEEICDADIDTLQSLIDKSLLRRQGERFWMLETIREYAAEQLEQDGEAEVLAERHAEYFLALAEEAGRGAPDEDVEQGRGLRHDLDNLRSALGWLIGAGDVERELRLATAAFWSLWTLREPARAEGVARLRARASRRRRFPISSRSTRARPRSRPRISARRMMRASTPARVSRSPASATTSVRSSGRSASSASTNRISTSAGGCCRSASASTASSATTPGSAGSPTCSAGRSSMRDASRRHATCSSRRPRSSRSLESAGRRRTPRSRSPTR